MKKLWIVYEDNHGAVSYWDNYKQADEERIKIIHDGWSEEEITEVVEDESRRQGRKVSMSEAFEDVVFISVQPLNKSWIEDEEE